MAGEEQSDEARRGEIIPPFAFPALSPPVRIPPTTLGSQRFNGSGEAAIVFTSLLLLPPPPLPPPPPSLLLLICLGPLCHPLTPLSPSIREYPFTDHHPSLSVSHSPHTHSVTLSRRQAPNPLRGSAIQRGHPCQAQLCARAGARVPTGGRVFFTE